MTVKEFFKDRVISYLVFTGVYLFCIGMGMLFQIESEYLTMIGFMILLGFLIVECWEYHRKNKFYRDFLGKLELLDQKYLITEMMERPEILEGRLFEHALYEIDKSMKERMTQMEDSVREFQEYIEMWIHEIKIPISSLMLMNYNHKMDFDKEKKQLTKLNHYVEQILFYSRADASSKDYLLKKTCLEDVVNKVVLEQKDILIENRFQIEKEGLDCFVHTDAKWLGFMLGQIVNNSVKYKKEQAYLKFTGRKEQDTTLLVIEDHGIGIPLSDIHRVFEKSFTGENGRKVPHATGMGLFLCKKMCDKLGHGLSIESKEQQYTKVCFQFGKNRYVEDVLK